MTSSRGHWLDVSRDAWTKSGEDSISLIAAGIAFYALIALFPAIAAAVSLWGLLSSPEQIAQQIGNFAAMLPPSSAGIVTQQAQSVANSTGHSMSVAAVGGILLSLYSTSKGTAALMQGLNIAYDTVDERGFVSRTLVALFLAVTLVIGMVLAFACMAALPSILAALGLNQTGQVLISILRWPLLALLVVLGLGFIYRVAPHRPGARFRWASPGALFATALWLIGSVAFSIYVANFGNYNATYGTLGTVIAALTWFWLSAYIILLGAELNAVTEGTKPQSSNR